MLNLDEAIEFLSKAVKASCALDAFKHIDLTLFPAREQERAMQCLIITKRAIDAGELSQAEFDRRVGFKSS